MTTHTATHLASTGGTYYAFPTSQSLADWETYRVQLSEASSPNLGRYQGSLDDTNGSEWVVFAGSTQPSSFGEAIATISAVSAGIKAKTDTIGTIRSLIRW